MSCKETFIPRTKLEERLAKEFGMNNKDRDTLLALSKSDEFKSWYKKREGKEFDENGDGRSIYPALRRYYNNKFFSVNANTTIRNDKGRFSSHNARQLAIDYIIGNFIDKYSKGSRYVDTDETIYDEEGNEVPNPNYGKLKLHRFNSKEDIAQAVVDSIYFIAKDSMDNVIESTLPESVREDFRNLLLLTDDMLEDSKEYKAIISKYAKDNTSKIVINDGYDLAAIFSNNDKIVKILRDRYLKKSVDSDYQFDYSEIMRNILTNNQLATVQQMNQYAMYDELSDGIESDFLQEVYDDNRMNIIVNFGENEEAEYDEENGDPDDAVRQELEGKENSEGDNTIAKANSHMGAFNDFMKHVDNPIKAYLGQLDQVDSIDDMTPDTNNELGLPMKMNVAEVCTVLYQYVNKTSPEAMRESIARIARDIPGMKGLMKIYNDTSSNSMEGLDLLFSLYTNFGKIPFGKSQVIYDGEESEVKVSNERGLRINALRLTLLNEFRGTGLTIDSRIAEDKVSEINDLINNYNGTEESRTNIIREINNYLNYLLPSLTNGTVSSYTLKDGADGFKNNAKALIGQIRTVTEDIINLQISYESLREEQREIYKEINGINRALNKPFDLDYKKVRELQNKRNELRNKLGKLYAKDYTSKVQSSIFNLANTVIDNTLVRTDLNSPNIHGDMSSDIINNNMMTNLINTLQNSEALKNYGDEKFKSEQYRLSNILVEKVDDNGNIINFGLFRLSTIETVDEETGEIIEETKYVPTEYAKDLISFELFDGAINKYSGVAALYSEMTKSDYIATAFNEFFKEDTQNDGEIKTARYFTRIPSDAPKTFVMRAPKYDTLGLISNGVIDRTHPVFKQMRNMFEQEVHDAVTALSKFFVIENGKIVIDYEQEIIDANGNKVKNPNYLKPKFKQGWSNETKDARKAFDIYHTKTDNKTGKTYFLESIDGSVKDVEFRLVGRVFSSDKFVISTNQKNYLQELIGEGRGNGVINFLYGREQDGNGLNIVENADGTVSFSFNDNQNKSIDEAIENFIKDYIKDCNERFEKSHVKLDANHNTEKDKIDFAINTFLMYNNFNDLLEGNTKFYKNSQDFLKRAKEMQASGIPYGIVSYDKRTTPDLSIINSRLSTANITIGGRKIELRNGFRGVTIKNTIRTSEEADRLFGTEKQGFKNSVLVQKGIIDIDIAKRLKKLYSNTKTNDAQSYITLDEWIRRVTAQGQFARYENLIRKLIDPNYKLTADEVDEFVQVQKNFYYDQHYNKELGVTAPRQIKNAEFVIIPKFVQGTDLEKVYNLMVEQDIDQLNTQETSKAGKANVLTLWDNDGVLTDEAIADFKDALSSETSEAVELFSYNNLYKQQDVPQHMDTENKAGIQIMKKILDNIVEEYDESGKPTGLYAKKKELMDAYSENIKESFAKLMETLDIPLNENGYPELEYVENSEYEDLGHWKIKGLNYEKLFKLLKDEARRTGVNSNVSEFFELDKWGNPLMPPFMSNVSSKLESIIQSLFNNNITRQKLPGFHAAQVTGVGIANKWTIKSQEGYFEKKARQGIKTSNNLRYHPVVNGEIQAYAEVIIPKPDYLKNVDDDEALKFMQEHNSDIFIGYRIPTEGKQSVSVMKVVGFLDKSQGSTIIVPDDWVSQTGADFDVDSIYAITMTPDKDGVIRFGMDNRIHRNNLIVKNMIDILSDPASIEENLSCSNFKDIIDARDEILEGTPVAKQKSYRSPYNFFDQADYQEDAMSGARLKGMSVTRDTLCSVSNTVKPFIGRPITVIYSAEKVKYEDLINAFGEENVQKSTDGKFYQVKHNTFGWSKNNRNVSGRLITAYSSQTTAHILDAIKEGNIPNVNELTFGIYKMFPDLGSDYRTAVSFMMTPGVSRVVSFYNANRSIYAEVNPNRKNDNRQFVMDAVRQIAVEQGIAGEFDKYSEILQKLEDAYGDVIKNTFGIADFSFIKNSTTDKNIPFNAQLQIDRIKERGVFKKTPVEGTTSINTINAVYDLLTIFQYQYLAKTAQQVGDYARVLNPDKFGAKVTAHATRKTLNDIRKLVGNSNPILYVGEGFDTKSIIEAIYPGIKSSYNDVYDLYRETGEIDESVDQISVNNKWISDYVSSTGESLYPPLNYFLKYATVTSTLVEEQVFATESERFRLMISKLGTYLGRNLTEQETLEFKRYILNQIYRNTEFLQENGEYGSINNYDDVERITGINKPIKFNFTVEDINNPTEEEKEAFRQLTPAQKVLWIKQNARDAGIFAYLETNLHNASQSSVYANTQTITFNSNAIDEESALAGMRKAWKNKIWFVKETVRDLFKYSIVAENYTISRKGITRLMVNSILRDTEFAKNVVTTLNNFGASGNDYLNYIRGHADKLGILTFDTRDEVITDAFRYDIVTFDLNNKKNLGYKYKIINKKDDSFPMFIKLVDNTSGNTILMEGSRTGDYIIYHPLNKLMPNENSDFSIKESNNLYPRVEFYYEYKAYIKKCINRAENETIIFDKNVNDYKYKNANKVNIVDNVDLRELAKTNLGIKALLDNIEKLSSDITKRGMFIRNGKLADLRPSVEEGDPNSYIPYTDSNNKQYIIKHIDTNEKRGDYSINDYLAMGKSIVMEAYDNGYTPNHEKIANEIINRFIIEKDSDIAEIVRSGIKGELAKVSDVFYVMPRTKVSMESNVGEVLHSGVIGMANRRAIGDEEAAHKLYEMDQSGINPENIDDIENNIAPTVDYIHDYVKMTANNLIDHVKNFYYDSNDISHGIDDPDFVKYLTDNPKEFNRLLNLLGDIKGFINEMNFIAKNNLDINAQDVNIQTALNEINKIIGDLDRSELISKINNTILEYLKNQSDDPLIINELYDYTHGYHNIGKVEDLFTDAQEAPIPLMQIVLHLATKNVRADDMKHFKNARLFKQKVKGLIDSGHVDLNKIIDENGRIIQSYNNKLVEDYEKYKDELEAIVKNNPQGKNSEEYIKKLHEYKEWKLKNFHQEYVDEYYREILDAEKEIIDFNNGFLGAYRKYKELTNRRVDILSHNINGNLTQQQKDDLKQVQDEIDLLTSTTGKDHIYELIPFGLDRNSYTKDDWDAVNNSFEAAAALDSYIKKVAKIKDKYFNKSEKDGFRETLKNKLKIVFDYENAQIPDSILANSAEYQDAKRWVELNAKLTLDPAFNKMLEEAYKELGVGHLGHSFSYFNLIKARGARDINGIVDGTKFTDKDIEDIKKEQQLDYQTGKLNGYDLGNLIQNGNESPFVWLTSFWKNMTVDGVTNSEYMRIVNDINKIIIKVYDSNTKQVNFTKTDSNGKPLLTQKDMIDLVSLYEELSNTQKHFDTTNGRSVHNFIEQNVDTSISPQQQQRFNEEKAAAEALYGVDSINYKLWEKINTETIDEDGETKKVPNHFIYGSIKPKNAVGNIVRDADDKIISVTGNAEFMRWIDVQKTIANDTIKQFVYSVPTQYYLEEKRRIYTQQPGEKEEDRQVRIAEWEEKNHIFNPYTHAVEPIQCWTRRGYKGSNIGLAAATGSSAGIYSYEPRFAQIESEIKSGKNGEPDYRNHSYVEGNMFKNYKGSNSTYNNNVIGTLTDEEKQVKKEFEQILAVYAKNSSAKRYIEDGSMPMEKKNDETHNAKWHAKQALHSFGWYYMPHNPSRWQTDIDYEHDYNPVTPGLRQLINDQTKEKLRLPKRSDFPNTKQGQLDYEAKKAQIESENKQIEKDNKEISNQLMDKNWVDIMERFIVQAGHFNSVQENKNLIYFGLDYLRTHNVYKHNLGSSNLNVDKHNSFGNSVNYEKEGYGESTLAVYEAFARRFIFNQFKKDQGKFTKVANILQQMSSAKYMMLNVTGGISNVLLGESQIAMESFANEYFSAAEWSVGKQLWINSIGSFSSHLYDNEASDIGDGLCKLFQTLEFDSITELREDNPDAAVKWQRTRNALYALQTIGEHFMQNGALLTMLSSHRLIQINDRLTGKQRYVAWSYDRYIRDLREQALKNVISNPQDFDNFVKSIKEDPNDVKDYAWRKKDLITQFVKTLSRSEQEKFIEEKKKLEKDAKEKFEQYPTLFDQFELKDGYAEFKLGDIKNGIILSNLNEDDAYRILGEIKNKVISVNKKIHGVYDKLGASRLEQEWYGGLVMQYHKHIWPGIMKRWRRQGYYNEDRQSNEKGAYWSIIDFLSIPYKNMKDMPDSSKSIMTGIQNYFKAAFEFLSTIKLNYQLLPNYEQANIRRVLIEICAYMSAVAASVALKLAADDDDEKDGIPYNMAIYLTDRFASETIMYTPTGAYGEAKTLWSSPIAAQTNVSDLLESINVLSHLIIEGDDFDPTYRSGIYAGQNKVKILLTRNIPIVRSGMQVWRLPKNNKYYKRQSNGVNGFSDVIVNLIQED